MTRLQQADLLLNEASSMHLLKKYDTEANGALCSNNNFATDLKSPLRQTTNKSPTFSL